MRRNIPTFEPNTNWVTQSDFGFTPLQKRPAQVQALIQLLMQSDVAFLELVTQLKFPSYAEILLGAKNIHFNFFDGHDLVHAQSHSRLVTPHHQYFSINPLGELKIVDSSLVEKLKHRHPDFYSYRMLTVAEQLLVTEARHNQHTVQTLETQ